MALRHHLQREADAYRQHAGVDDRAQREAQAVCRDRLDGHAQHQRQRAAGDELPAGHEHRAVQAMGRAAHQHHVRGPGHAAGDHPPVAGLEVRQAGRRATAGQRPGAHHAADGGQPGRPVRQVARHDPAQHRHQRDVQRREEAGIRHRGGEHADLLHRGAEEQQRAEAGDVGDVTRARLALLGAQGAPLAPGERRDHHRAEREAQAGERERADAAGADRLRDEGRAPDQRHQQQQQVRTRARQRRMARLRRDDVVERRGVRLHRLRHCGRAFARRRARARAAAMAARFGSSMAAGTSASAAAAGPCGVPLVFRRSSSSRASRARRAWRPA